MKSFHYLNLDMSQTLKEKYLDFFNQNKSKYEKEYVSSSGKSTELGVVNGYENPEFMEAFLNNFPRDFIKETAFLFNYGIQKHKDGTRNSVISYEISNIDNIGLTLEENDIEIELSYFNTKGIFWNPQYSHHAKYSKNIRVFYQIEFFPNNGYEYYVNVFKQLGLI